jgi:ABC-type multidrug transport system fused ATPase/permease subunit
LSSNSIIDNLSVTQQVLVMPMFCYVLLYGALRFSTAMFTELREMLFARVTQQAVRQVALEVFGHLHALSLRFHLERQTGGVSRDIERGTRSISSLISYTLYSILPTLVEIGLVLGILFVRYDIGFVIITLISLVSYIVFTVKVSNWRIDIRRTVNESDSAANTRAVDSLLNYETVKYFNNEAFEHASLQRAIAQMGRRRDAQPDHTFRPQSRPAGNHRPRRYRHDVARDQRRGRRHDDDWRLRAGQCLPDPALHPA